jgi:type I restriction enzyme S subunit
MSSKALASILFPLPPLPEQDRIVARIDQLMARCDALEKLRKEREEKRLAVHATAIKRLLDAPDGSACEFIQQHFGELYTVKENVAELRKAILQLAVMGRLVPQSPSDPPASELLKEIETEKQRLVKVGKIKQPKPLPPIKPEEVPYELPQGWEWVIFGDIAAIERGGSPRPIKAFLTDDPEGLNWIKIGDTDQGGKYITSTKEKIRPEGLTKTRMVYPGDFLLTNSMSFGRPYITQIEGCIHDGWLRISPPDSVDKDYLYNLLSSSFIRRMFEAAAAGAVVLNLNSDKVRELPIPLPPLPEQHRIVARIDQLMALCDTLDQQIDAATGKQTELLDALMAQV